MTSDQLAAALGEPAASIVETLEYGRASNDALVQLQQRLDVLQRKYLCVVCKGAGWVSIDTGGVREDGKELYVPGKCERCGGTGAAHAEAFHRERLDLRRRLEEAQRWLKDAEEYWCSRLEASDTALAEAEAENRRQEDAYRAWLTNRDHYTAAIGAMARLVFDPPHKDSHAPCATARMVTNRLGSLRSYLRRAMSFLYEYDGGRGIECGQLRKEILLELAWADTEPEREITEGWLEACRGERKPPHDDGFRFGLLFVFRSDEGWAALYGSMERSEAIPVRTRNDLRKLASVLPTTFVYTDTEKDGEELGTTT